MCRGKREYGDKSSRRPELFQTCREATEGQFKNVLEHAVDEARKKGAKDLAVIGSQAVFVVNVPNNVVVTVMSREDMKDRIFTNIDSAVLIPK